MFNYLPLLETEPSPFWFSSASKAFLVPVGDAPITNRDSINLSKLISNYSIEIFYELSQYSDYHKRYPKDIQKWKPYFQILHNHIPVYSMISDQPNSTSSIGNIIQESIESIYLIKYLHFF